MKAPVRWLDAGEDAPRGAAELLAAASPPPAFSEAVRGRLAIGVAKTAALPASSIWASVWVKAVLVATVGGATGVAAHSLGGKGAGPPVPVVARAPVSSTAVEPIVPSATAEASPAPELRPAPPDRTPKPKLDPRLAEVELLEKARSLVSAKPAAALSLVAQHGRDFPRGRLGAEADLIAAQALLGMGDVNGAKRRARASLSRYPSGLYARQLRAIAEK
jgi:hypothetical protein